MRALPLLLVAIVLAGCGSSSPSSSSNATSPPANSSSNALTGTQNHVHSIAILPQNPRTIYMGAHYHLEKSSDGGVTWHPLANQMFLSIALDPSHPATIYGVSLQRGSVMSTDGGATWKLIAGVPRGQATGVAFDPVHNTVFMYGNGLYRSTDGGGHWTKNGALQSVNSVAVGSDGAVYAATGTGLEVSHDGGRHWTAVGVIGNQPIIQVAAARSVAYAVTPMALYKTASSGRTWTALSSAPQGVEFVGVAPSNPGVIVAEVAGKGFETSHNGGRTWRAANSGITSRNFSASTIRVAPASPNVVYTGSWGIHFYASHDGGLHWTQTATIAH